MWHCVRFFCPLASQVNFCPAMADAPTRSDFEQDLGYLLVQACRLYRRARDARLRPLDLHCRQDVFLMHLGAAPEEKVGQSTLCECLDVEPPTMSNMAQRLEKKGLVERTEDPDDARMRRACLTEKGEDRRAKVYREWQDLEENAFASLTAEEQTLLQGLLQRVLQNLQ